MFSRTSIASVDAKQKQEFEQSSDMRRNSIETESGWAITPLAVLWSYLINALWGIVGRAISVYSPLPFWLKNER